jgi:hypothetical protein
VKIIDLPVVGLQTDTLKALGEMVRSGRTAVLVETASGHAVLNADTAIEALRGPAAAHTLADIYLADILTDATDSVSPGGWRGIEENGVKVVQSTFKVRGVDRLLVGLSGQEGTGWLAVSDDEFGRRLGFQLVYCTCPKDADEIWQPFEVPDRVCPNHQVPLNCT